MAASFSLRRFLPQIARKVACLGKRYCNIIYFLYYWKIYMLKNVSLNNSWRRSSLLECMDQDHRHLSNQYHWRLRFIVLDLHSTCWICDKSPKPVINTHQYYFSVRLLRYDPKLSGRTQVLYKAHVLYCFFFSQSCFFFSGNC